MCMDAYVNAQLYVRLCFVCMYVCMYIYMCGVLDVCAYVCICCKVLQCPGFYTV